MVKHFQHHFHHMKNLIFLKFKINALKHFHTQHNEDIFLIASKDVTHFKSHKHSLHVSVVLDSNFVEQTYTYT